MGLAITLRIYRMHHVKTIKDRSKLPKQVQSLVVEDGPARGCKDAMKGGVA